MRKFLRRVGILVFLLFALGVALGMAANHAHEKYNQQRKFIIKQCEMALPVLNRRYRQLLPLLQRCEDQPGWTNSFADYVEQAPPAFIHGEKSFLDQLEGDARRDHVIKRFIGRVTMPAHFVSSDDGDYSDYAKDAFGVGFHPAVRETNGISNRYIVVDFTELNDGISRYLNARTAFEKVMGAAEIEPNLPQVVMIATNYPAINRSGLIGKFEFDLAATDHSIHPALSHIYQLVEQYNTSIAHSYMAQAMTMPQIGIDSKLTIWDATNRPN